MGLGLVIPGVSCFISRPVRHLTRGIAQGVVSVFTDDKQTQIIAGAAVATVAGLVTNVLLLDFAGKADTVWDETSNLFDNLEDMPDTDFEANNTGLDLPIEETTSAGSMQNGMICGTVDKANSDWHESWGDYHAQHAIHEASYGNASGAQWEAGMANMEYSHVG